MQIKYFHYLINTQLKPCVTPQQTTVLKILKHVDEFGGAHYKDY